MGNVNNYTKIVIFITGSFLTLHISYIFCSRLFSVLTTPLYDPLPTTFEQLVNTDVRIYDSPAFNTYLKGTNKPLWRKMQKKLIKSKGNAWHDFINGSFASYLTSTSLLYIKNNEELNILPERVS